MTIHKCDSRKMVERDTDLMSIARHLNVGVLDHLGGHLADDRGALVQGVKALEGFEVHATHPGLVVIDELSVANHI